MRSGGRSDPERQEARSRAGRTVRGVCHRVCAYVRDDSDLGYCVTTCGRNYSSRNASRHSAEHTGVIATLSRCTQRSRPRPGRRGRRSRLLMRCVMVSLRRARSTRPLTHPRGHRKGADNEEDQQGNGPEKPSHPAASIPPALSANVAAVVSPTWTVIPRWRRCARQLSPPRPGDREEQHALFKCCEVMRHPVIQRE
jgi:hypothetical protein